MSESEIVSVKIAARLDAGIDLLPDVLRQLGAMVRLLTEFANDPRISKVEVLNLTKQSPLEARLRVVTIREPGKSKHARSRPVIRRSAQPVRRLERVFDTVSAKRRPRSVDATGLTVLGDFAKQLRGDIATISTANRTMVIDSSLLPAINDKLGPVHISSGSITGILEGLNVHTKPWSFTIYPNVGPARVRCTFEEELFGQVQHAIRQVVTVHGAKEYVRDCPWPVRIIADRVDVREAARDGAWLSLVDDLAQLWDQAAEDERLIFLEEHTA